MKKHITGLEVATRRLPDGSFAIYARWPSEVTKLRVAGAR